MNGILNICKPLDVTSHDIVYKVRRLTGIKKVGHTGTLDPGASGVLNICLGKATKIFDHLVSFKKEYVAQIKLGIETDTQDSYGEVISQNDVNVSQSDILAAISMFTGEIKQIPPMYSALKHKGKKLYELARQGVEVERKPRTINIYNIDVLEIDVNNDIVTIKVNCSKGTYIRTLCHDIGKELGCGAHMLSLVRTKNGIFHIENCITLEDIEKSMQNNSFKELIVPIDTVFHNYDSVILNKEGFEKLRNGARIYNKYLIDNIVKNEDNMYRVYDLDNNFLAICQSDIDRFGLYLKLVKGFI